jgi:hypothetical protein
VPTIDGLKQKLQADLRLLTQAIEIDNTHTAAELQQDLTDLHEQLKELTRKAQIKLEEAKAVKGRADEMAKQAGVFAETMAALVDELGKAGAAIDPQEWEFGT